MKRNKMLRSLLLVLVLCLLVGMVAGSFVLFRVQITRLLSGVSTQNVLEVQNLNKQVLQAKFSDQFSMLEAQARYFAGVDLKDSAALKKTIAVTRGIGSFKKIAVANLDGVCTDYTGQPLANVAGKPYFRATVQSGGRQVSDRIELDENLEPILTLTYPLKRGREVQAVLVGTLSYSELKKLFSVSLFSGEGYIYIISREGNIIQPFAFTGYREEENDFYYAQVRSYDHQAGRFTGEDRVRGFMALPDSYNKQRTPPVKKNSR